MLFILYILLSCSEENTSSTPTLFKTRTSTETGITFQNTITSTSELNILNYIYYYNGAGIAAGDFNNDGLADLYFTANQSEDQLYLNNGNFQFENSTSNSGINNAQNWTTGVTTVDINNDGLLDIYVCKIGDYNQISGYNLLYVNQGNNPDGAPLFKEEAATYGLNFKGLSTQATFFDYDLDGDLDLFLLNHSTNPNQNYGKGSIRETPNEPSGDKLFENQQGFFVNISEQAGILQSKIGYGLGVSISDLNNDGYPDIYVGNDFFENDYLYLNNGNSTFNETITTNTGNIGHTTHFSMGNDIADINNDGYPDILSVDMLPEDLNTYKTSGAEFNYQIYQNYLNNGYTKQYMQNTLQLNNENGSFSETAYLSGIAATEWSWSPLIADFDNDGLNDIYITNGILGATNDMDFINFISNDEIQKSLGMEMKEKDMSFIEQIPKKKTSNYFYRNSGGSKFDNVSALWSTNKESYSNGAAYVDLDNDGDLDIVTNNVNEPAFILENKSDTFTKNHWLSLSFSGNSSNQKGIGAKVILYSDTLQLIKENYTTRGYLSSVAPKVYFGLGKRPTIDSLHIIWPNKSFEVIRNIKSDTILAVDQTNAAGNYYENFRKNTKQYLLEVPPLFNSKHQENTTIDFNRNPLIPFAYSNEGPDISIADINNDGLDDVFISGAKRQASQLIVQQKDGTFISQQPELFEEKALNEDTAHVFLDVDGDGYKDLIVVSGGNEFHSGDPILPRLYRNKLGVFIHDTIALSERALSASNVKALKYDDDNYLDICITSGTFSQLDGNRSHHLMLRNTGNGNFMEVKSKFITDFYEHHLSNALVTADLDGDGTDEIISAGDWAPVSIYSKRDNTLVYEKENGLDQTHGWWNTLEVADLDNDGDLDIVAGNWGLNSRLKASSKEPMTLYRKDFDGNGQEETIVTYFYKGRETTFNSKDELVKQLPGINKDFLSYSDFAEASIEELFGKENIKTAEIDKVYELASCYFENVGNGSFKKHLLPFSAQISSVNDIHVEDFNDDGYLDLFLVGNNFEISTQLSSLDASHGVLLLNDAKGNFSQANDQKFNVSGAARKIGKLRYQGENYLIITRNNDQPQFFKTNK